MSPIGELAARMRSVAPRPGVFMAEPLPGREWVRLAYSIEGFALILPGEDESPSRPSIELEHIRVRFNAPCQIETNGAARTERLTLVECISADRRLEGMFLEVAPLMLPASQGDLAKGLVAAIVDLVDLF